MDIKKKTIIFISVIIIVIFTISFFVIIPATRNIKDISFKISTIKIEVEKKYDSRITLRTAMKKLKTIKQDTEKFMDIYVKEKEELKIITELENIATENNLSQTIDLLYPEKKLAPPPKTELEKNQATLNLKLNGNYLDIIKYLYDLKRISYYINFNSISIDTATKQTNANEKLTDLVQVNLSGNFFILPQTQIE